ncbi:MAG: DUF2188 domain-containing protein [Candidatus Tectomicrobia bacterium]|uniref:DUF2188 domain-containing protein n=1 Tax=Tectimicrobiota bacterium TaxID=2528274 RepID=A0A932MP64_UNCTE|nr:DUF2188 domain-containing protein [Candidatus Tectomicrobia bacterium]
MSRQAKNQSSLSRAARVHVIAHQEGWAIKQEGQSRASKICSTKEAAVRNASQVAVKGQDVVVHKKDGSIQSWKRIVK